MMYDIYMFVTDYLRVLVYIIYLIFLFFKENAKPSTCRHAIASDGYDCVHSLAQYYQMVCH